MFFFYVKFAIFAVTIYVTAIRTYYFKSYQLSVSFQLVIATIFRLEMTKGFYLSLSTFSYILSWKHWPEKEKAITDAREIFEITASILNKTPSKLQCALKGRLGLYGSSTLNLKFKNIMNLDSLDLESTSLCEI